MVIKALIVSGVLGLCCITFGCGVLFFGKKAKSANVTCIKQAPTTPPWGNLHKTPQNPQVPHWQNPQKNIENKKSEK